MQVLVSLGNAMLVKHGELNAVTALNAGVHAAALGIHGLLDAGHRVVVTHGHDESLLCHTLEGRSRDGLLLEHDEAVAEGLIGYRLEQELRNLSNSKRSFVTIMTQTLVALSDIQVASQHCLVGPAVSQLEAERLEQHSHWHFKETIEGWRRVVACPPSLATLQVPAMKTLMNAGHSIICAGGGLAVTRDVQGKLSGADAIVDKDLASAQLALALGMDAFLISTDVSGVYDNWSSSSRKLQVSVSEDELDLNDFEAKTMRPKLGAALQFAQSGGYSAIGQIGQEVAMLEGRTGTRVNCAESLA